MTFLAWTTENTDLTHHDFLATSPADIEHSGSGELVRDHTGHPEFLIASKALRRKRSAGGDILINVFALYQYQTWLS